MKVPFFSVDHIYFKGRWWRLVVNREMESVYYRRSNHGVYKDIHTSHYEPYTHITSFFLSFFFFCFITCAHTVHMFFWTYYLIITYYLKPSLVGVFTAFSIRTWTCWLNAVNVVEQYIHCLTQQKVRSLRSHFAFESVQLNKFRCLIYSLCSLRCVQSLIIIEGVTDKFHRNINLIITADDPLWQPVLISLTRKSFKTLLL